MKINKLKEILSNLCHFVQQKKTVSKSLKKKIIYGFFHLFFLLKFCLAFDARKMINIKNSVKTNFKVI